MKKKKAICGLTSLFVGIVLVSSLLAAPPAKDAKPAGSQSGLLSPLGYDVILLMDVSGSMKRTDPHGYQKLAAKLFVTLLKVEDRIGIITFGDSAQVLLPLTPEPHRNKDKIFQAIQKINPQSQFTDLHDAIRLGLKEMGKTKRENRILILLSDGKLDLGSREKEKKAMSELSQLYPEFSKERIKIFSIAFTDLSDVQFMEDVARKTGGFFRYAKKAKDLPAIFGSLFEKMKSPEMTPLTDNQFLIDESVKEAIVMVSKEPGTAIEITDPGNKKYSAEQPGPNMQWLATEIFDVVTIPNPTVGSWKVSLSGSEGNRIFILTNLKLQCPFDKNDVEKGEKILLEAFLVKDGGRVKEREILSRVSFSAEVVWPDKKIQKVALMEKGEGKDPQKMTGIYTGEMVADQVGEYSLRILAESRVFKREKNIKFRVKGPAGQEPLAEEAPKAAVALTDSAQPEEKKEKKEGSLKELLVKLGVINLLILSAGGGVYLLLIGGGKDIVKKRGAKKKSGAEVKGKTKKEIEEKKGRKEGEKGRLAKETKEEKEESLGEENKEEN